MPRPIVPAAFLLLAAALAILPARAADSPREIPACPLLNVDEVAAAFGTPVTATEQPAMGGGPGQGRMTTCFWAPTGGRLGATVSLVVWSWPAGHPAAPGYVEAIRLAAQPDRPPPADVAVGDEALWDGDRLHARKGDVGFTLAASLNALDAAPDAEAKLVALGATVVSRLP